MAKVTINRETPQPPPIKEFVITLSAQEGQALRRLLGYGVASTSLTVLGLRNLLNALNEADPVPYHSKNLFKETAVAWEA